MTPKLEAQPSNVNIDELKKKLKVSKFTLLTNKNGLSFFGILILYFKYVVDESVPTAATDGKRIIFNPNFMNKLTLGELNWVMAHEVMHVANGHLRRRKTRNAEMFNIACDYAIHCILKEFENDMFKMPKDVLYDAKYNGMSAEEIYDDLQANAQYLDMSKLAGQMLDSHEGWGKDSNGGGEGDEDGDGEKNGEGQGGGKSLEDGEGQGGSFKEANEEEWKQRITNAAKQASGKMAGSGSAYLKKILQDLEPPRKNWRVLLQEFVEPEVYDYSFKPPSKKYYGVSDCLFPDFNDEDDTVKNIVFFVDVSGSMSDEDIKDVYSEVVGAVAQFPKMTGYLGYFDTQVTDFKKFEDVSDVLANRPHCGGGTDFQACFEFLHRNEDLDFDEIAGIIILTDGYCGFGKSEKLSEGKKVLWAMLDEGMPEAPFGNTTYIRSAKKKRY